MCVYFLKSYVSVFSRAFWLTQLWLFLFSRFRRLFLFRFRLFSGTFFWDFFQCCNHPFLNRGVEERILSEIPDELHTKANVHKQLVDASGKVLCGNPFAPPPISLSYVFFSYIKSERKKRMKRKNNSCDRPTSPHEGRERKREGSYEQRRLHI